jgi:hypothetical protein
MKGILAYFILFRCWNFRLFELNEQIKEYLQTFCAFRTIFSQRTDLKTIDIFISEFASFLILFSPFLALRNTFSFPTPFSSNFLPPFSFFQFLYLSSNSSLSLRAHPFSFWSTLRSFSCITLFLFFFVIFLSWPFPFIARAFKKSMVWLFKINLAFSWFTFTV